RAHEGLEIAPERLVELLPLELRHLHPHAVHRRVEAAPEERQRAVELRLVELLDAELLRDAAEELVQRVVRHGTAELRVGLRVDRVRVEQPLDEPRRGAIGETLELGHVEARPLAEKIDDERMAQARRPLKRTQRTVEPPLPTVRERERTCLRLVGRGKSGQRPEALTLGRLTLDRPREP